MINIRRITLTAPNGGPDFCTDHRAPHPPSRQPAATFIWATRVLHSPQRVWAVGGNGRRRAGHGISRSARFSAMGDLLAHRPWLQGLAMGWILRKGLNWARALIAAVASIAIVVGATSWRA